MGFHCICLYTIPPTHSTCTLPPISSPDSHLWPRSTYYIPPHHCYYTTRLCYNGVSLYMSVYHTTYTFHLHTPSSYLLSRFSPVATVNILHHISHHTTVTTLYVGLHCIYLYTIPPTLPPLISSPGSHLWPRSTYYITYHTTPLLPHYTLGYIVYVCILYLLHSLLLSPLQALTCGHGQHTTSHITPHHCYHIIRWVTLCMSVYYTSYTPSSYLLSRLSPVATVNILHHISHHTTVTTLYVGLHCVCLYTIPPTLPPLISSPGSHLWPRSTYYITYHTTPLLPHYTLGYIVYVCILYLLHSLLLSPLQALTCGHGQHTTSHITPHHCYHITRLGYIVYICIPYHLHILPSHSLLLSPLQVLTCGHGQCTTSHITPHHCYLTTRLGYNGVSLYISVYHTTYTFHLHTPSFYLLSRFSPVATVNALHHRSHHTTVITLHVWVTIWYHRHCQHKTCMGYNGVSLYMSVYHTTYTFHLHNDHSHHATITLYHGLTHHTTLQHNH